MCGYNAFRLSDNRANLGARFSKGVLGLSDNRANPRTLFILGSMESPPMFLPETSEKRVLFGSPSLYKTSETLLDAEKTLSKALKNSGNAAPIYKFSRLAVARPPVSSDRVETAVSSNETAVSTWQTRRDRRLGKRDRRLALRRWRDRRLVKRDDGLATCMRRDGGLGNPDGVLVSTRRENLFFAQKLPPILVWGLIVSPNGLLGFVHLQIG
ncbi:unnamed protein product, partial [Sphenostylis stenocarpa]